jgi:predicted ATP-dependent protease
VNQHGEIQAIGGVNEKIEGFFDVCKARGLSGEHGVLIPASNVANLMLRNDVVEAARNGLFHVFPVANVDQGMALLTGLTAGEANASGIYPPDTINGRVQARLTELAQLRQNFADHGKDKEGL